MKSTMKSVLILSILAISLTGYDAAAAQKQKRALNKTGKNSSGQTKAAKTNKVNATASTAKGKQSMDVPSDNAKKAEGQQADLNSAQIAADHAGKPEASGADKTKPSYIGEAWLEKDGRITLHLSSDADGNHVNAMFSYETDDKDYQKILKHLGGLKPGETKPVKPFEK